MKEFSKLKLKMFTEMNEVEMKNIMGGGGYGENGDGYCRMTCNGENRYITCYGVCINETPHTIKCVTDQNMVSGSIYCPPKS
ncbi:hypothetical protein [Dysgonomonas sp. ZJ709]|uniref:hypothetical protein n=1 Tax=Dysgonomonas sp. ZJ709 TaxID=2709797 RepID=UPI0013EBC6EF|nr:hypothetical protein [Dysgonomonas sp. ZJ709]